MKRRRGHGERGAVLPLSILVLGALIAFTSLAVDLGFQRVARRDMQALADVVALDLVRRLDGSTAAALTPTMDAALALSVDRNEDSVAGDDLEVSYRLGTVDSANQFTPVASTGVPTAVEVTAETEVDYFFRPGKGGVIRRAVASTIPEACFSIGSFAATLSSQESLILNALIGDALNLGALSYTGLGSSSISLFDLASEIGVGSVDELLTTENELDDLFLASAEVLERQGQVANANILRTIAATVPHAEVSVGDVVAASPGSESALTTFVNVLDLVAGSAFLANGENALSVPGLSVNIGQVINLTTSARVVESQRQRCGRVGTRADTAQIELDATGSVVNVPITVLGLNLTVAVGPLDLDLDTADAFGILRRILCGSTSGNPTATNPNGIDVSVVTSLLQASIAVPFRVTESLPLLTIDIRGTSRASTSEPSTSSSAVFRNPSQGFGTVIETGTGTVGLSGLAVDTTVTSANVFGVLPGTTAAVTNAVLAAVENVVINPLIQAVDDALLGPFIELFGLNVAGADVTWLSPLTCNGPALVD